MRLDADYPAPDLRPGLICATIVTDAGGTVEHAWYNARATGHADRVGAAIT